ncbi:MAG TPA: beta-ketoacyl-[acyl-carrier-protein] synthase family protein [Gemmataceae bacterium]|nr:beta-ketoacyl-[acyl-carrier-protein] synthase family protein [Gemmataceae bacterium]
MAASTRRAVLTGIGALSALGLDNTSFREGLRSGRSGVRPIRLFDVSGLPVRIGAEVPDFDAKKFLKAREQKKALIMMARTIQLAVAAAQLAVDDSRLDPQQIDPTRFGTEFGAGLIASELDEIAEASLVSANCQPGAVDLQKWGAQGIDTIPPKWMLKYLPNMLACHVSIFHNAQGPNNTITENDVAGLLALGEAYRILARDQADIFLVGGAESRINPLSMVRQCLFDALSRRNEEPEKACRPFDRRRDGFVLGEGGGVLILEELEHAKRRGARIYGEVVGFGASFDPPDPKYGPDGRSGAGLARAIRAALKEAGIGPEEIDHVNAHGLSAVASDAWEARGLQEVFGNLPEPVPVFAAKSYFGNVGAGGSTLELAASLYALEQGVVPRTLNYEQPDPACPVAVTTEPRPVRRPYVLKVSFTQMGQCGALVVRKWE